jgi:hypothetical protein
MRSIRMQSKDAPNRMLAETEVEEVDSDLERYNQAISLLFQQKLCLDCSRANILPIVLVRVSNPGGRTSRFFL